MSIVQTAHLGWVGRHHWPALRLGLVNNMPDAALARTERQFIDILAAAAPDLAVSLSFYAVPGIPRGELGQAHLAQRGYRSTEDLVSEDLDALIVTGTEPKQPNLRDEPYWPALAALFDWIDAVGPSTMFSCLASHAAVLHYDGIERHRLAEKCCGLLEHAVMGGHPLVASLPSTYRSAHSRWNEVRRETLEQHGYRVLTAAAGDRVDLFVKQNRTLQLFFQGHPEYDSGTLFREYRRDVQRYLAGENAAYPKMPECYFDETEAAALDLFHERARADRSKIAIEELPVARPTTGDCEAASPMAGVLRTWLLSIAAMRSEPVLAPARAGGMRR